MTSIPKDKNALYDAIQQASEKLLLDYARIPVEFSRVDGVEGNIKGMTISSCDTLAYLIGWENLVLKWYGAFKRGDEIDFPESGFQWNELGRLAQHFYAQYEHWSYPDLLNEFNATTNEILSLVDSLSEEQLYGESWYKNYTLGRMIQFNTSSPMKNVRTKVRRFLRENDFTEL